MATSSSERYEAAREALDDFDSGKWGIVIGAQMVADALRALIEPEHVNRTNEEVINAMTGAKR